MDMLDVEMYADPRQTARVPLDELMVAGKGDFGVRTSASPHQFRPGLLGAKTEMGTMKA